jgi:hypothetical protein
MIKSLFSFLHTTLHYFKSKQLFIGIASIICFAFGILVNGELALFLFLFAIFLVGKFSSKVYVILGLGILIFVPILLINGDNLFAEKLALYCYYLLISATGLEIIHFIQRLQKDNTRIENYTKHSSPQLLRNPFSYSTIEELIHGGRKLKHLVDTSIKATSQTTFITRYQDGFFRYFHFFVLGFFSLVSISIFRFQDLLLFRDLVVVPSYHNISTPDLSFVEQIIFNKMAEIIPPQVVSSIFFILIFSLGGFLSYLYLLKIHQLFSRHIEYVFSPLNKLITFGISILLVFNPFMFERFLMGQFNVIRGHVLFIPVLYYTIVFLKIFASRNFHIHNLLSEKHITVFMNFCWAITLLTLISTHHALFLLILLAFGFCGIIWSGRKSIARYISQSSTITTFANTAKIISTTTVILTPTFLIIFLRALSGFQKSTFDKFNSLQSGYDTSIIKSFSLQISEGQNLIERALIGSGSWNSPSFVEVSNIKVDLGFLANFSIYFNSWLSIFILMGLLGLIVGLILQLETHKNPLLTPFIVMIPISLLLSFGYAGNFQTLNQIFYKLPFMMILREPGKWFSLFIILLSLFITIYHEGFKPLYKKILLGALMIISIGNILIFFPLSNNLVYANYPKLLDEVAANCKKGEQNKVLFLPFTVYTYPSGSQVFSGNYASSYLDCTVLKPEITTLKDPNSSKSIVLASNSESIAVDAAVRDFIELEKQNTPDGQTLDPFDQFKKEMKRIGVSTIIVDDYNYDGSLVDELNLELFTLKLTKHIPPAVVEKDDSKSISLFYLD